MPFEPKFTLFAEETEQTTGEYKRFYATNIFPSEQEMNNYVEGLNNGTIPLPPGKTVVSVGTILGLQAAVWGTMLLIICVQYHP